MGVHRAAIDYVRERIVAGTPAAKLRRDHRARIRRSLALLEGGLGDYRSKADSRRRRGGR